MSGIWNTPVSVHLEAANERMGVIHTLGYGGVLESHLFSLSRFYLSALNSHTHLQCEFHFVTSFGFLTVKINTLHDSDNKTITITNRHHLAHAVIKSIIATTATASNHLTKLTDAIAAVKHFAMGWAIAAEGESLCVCVRDFSFSSLVVCVHKINVCSR